MVVSGGFNVFTAEVEAAVTELAAVREACVFGIPHEKWGEQVHAVVVADGMTEAEIIAYTKERLGGVKAPKSIEFIDAIPRTAAGKMDKKELRKKYWGDAQRMGELTNAGLNSRLKQARETPGNLRGRTSMRVSFVRKLAMASVLALSAGAVAQSGALAGVGAGVTEAMLSQCACRRMAELWP
jgi:hypothetical protein